MLRNPPTMPATATSEITPMTTARAFGLKAGLFAVLEPAGTFDAFVSGDVALCGAAGTADIGVVVTAARDDELPSSMSVLPHKVQRPSTAFEPHLRQMPPIIFPPA